MFSLYNEDRQSFLESNFSFLRYYIILKKISYPNFRLVVKIFRNNNHYAEHIDRVLQCLKENQNKLK